MRVALDPDEVQILIQVIQAALGERSRALAAASSPQEKSRLENETRVLEEARARLAVAHREAVVDESVEETFPASDSPAHGVVRERPTRK
jgi:hypothetical protein